MQDDLLPILEQIRRIELGEEGEVTVGAALDDLEDAGYRAIHSIYREGRDIDHVLVGPAGVFVVETKHYSGSGRIVFRNGQGIFVGERRRWNPSIEQAKRGAREVAEIVSGHCDWVDWVRPVVVFAGDWIVADQWHSTDVRVFTPESLTDYILQQQPILKRAEVNLLASRLERAAQS